MSRRTRVVWWSFGVLVAAAGAAAIASLSLLETDWGHERIRALVVARANLALGGRGTLHLGALHGGIGGHFAVDSLALLDPRGRVVAAASRAEFDGALAGFLTGAVRLRRLVLIRPFLLLDVQDSGLSVTRIVATRARAPAAVRPAMLLTLDSAEVRDGRIVLVTPGPSRLLPPVRREISRIHLAVGPTRLAHPDTAGGTTLVRRASAELSLPRVSLRHAVGTVRWWSDSLVLDLAQIRLPASRASVRGAVAWARPGGARLDLRVAADSVSLGDIAWVTTLIPKSGGTGSAVVHVRSGRDARDVSYAVTDADIRATRSRLTGHFTVTAGRDVAVTDLALDAQPLDLDLVREIFGEGVPNKAWQGALTGTLRARGGPLERLQLDDVRLTFTDRRVSGAGAQFALSGTLDVRAKPAQLRGLDVRLQDLDVRTLGAVVRAADSLHGALTGQLVLDGPLSDVRFHDLVLWHADGDRERSRFSGAGRLASDTRGRWLEAEFTLDTVAVATLLRDRTTVPLRGVVRGTLALRATADTLAIDAQLRAGNGSSHVRGELLLDSTRTWFRGEATLDAVDPRVVIARKDVPAMRLDGRAEVEVDDGPGRTDRHVRLTLDTTSVIGSSRVRRAQITAGVDSTGFHVDTAEIDAAGWRLSARGRLARTGVTHDTLRFAAHMDSLGPLRALLLDSAGAALADSALGSFGASGTLSGSLDSLTLAAEFGARGVRWSGVAADTVWGRASLARLPKAATGTLTLEARSVTAGGLAASRAEAAGTVRDGRSARVTAAAFSGDTLSAHAAADVLRSGDTVRVALDSLDLRLAANRWRLERPTQVVFAPRLLEVDSTVLRSARGATVALRVALPDSGAASGTLRVAGLGLEELAFTGLLAPDLSGRARGEARLEGTRDAPRLSFTAALDSVTVAGSAQLSLAATGSYENRRLRVEARGTQHAREVLLLSADLPVDLALRRVPARFPDDSLAVRVRTDALAIGGLEAVVPQVQGLAGTLLADVSVRGTWRHKIASGTVALRDGAFVHSRYGLVGRDVQAELELARDRIRLARLRMSDGDSRDTLFVSGVMTRDSSGWHADLTSASKDFKLMDDPRLATIDASWNVRVTGPVKQPFIEGELDLPNATFVIGQRRRVRPVKTTLGAEDADLPVGMPIIKRLHVTLGSDVRLRSRDANVQLSGALDVAGELSGPYVSGEILADRGTYRVDLGVLKRTFRVDSGTVRVAGTPDMPSSLDIWTSYIVRRADQDDIRVTAHLTGSTDAPRLELGSQDLGSAVAQSEIISYLIFGTPSFALDAQGQSTVRTATAALVPSLGGFLEGVLGSLLPFFSSLQVTTVAGSGPQSVTANPLDALLNSFALIAGRQIGTDSFLNISGGRCSGSRLTSTQSAAVWFGISLEYRPKRSVSAAVSVDPGSAPCSRVGKFTDVYQFGLDLFRDWTF